MKFIEAPVLDGVVSSPYGERIHPITKESRFHRGYDITTNGLEREPEVLAPCDAKVICVYSWIKNPAPEEVSRNNLGNFIVFKVISEGKTYSILYAHLKKVYSWIKTGCKVKAWTPVGVMGTTGLSTGIHLHFQVGSPQANDHLDPSKFLKDSFYEHIEGLNRSPF